MTKFLDIKTSYVLGAFILAVFVALPAYSYALVVDTGVKAEVKAEGTSHESESSRETQVEMTTTSTTEPEKEDETRGRTLSAIVDSDILTAELKSDIAEFKGTITPLVQSKADVDAYAKIVAEGKDEIQDIQLDQKELRVKFKEGVKLFGFIPMRASSKATISSEGEVAVHRPWYGALVRFVNSEDVSAEIKASLGSNSEATIRAFAANASAVDQVELMRKVVTAIDAHVEAEGKVSVK